MTVGELLRGLRTTPGEMLVEFDFCGLIPTEFHLHRTQHMSGVCVALGYRCRDSGFGRVPTVHQLTNMLGAIIGVPMSAYWCPPPRMEMPVFESEVWIDNYGAANWTILSGITMSRQLDRVILQTAFQR